VVCVVIIWILLCFFGVLVFGALGFLAVLCISLVATFWWYFGFCVLFGLVGVGVGITQFLGFAYAHLCFGLWF